MLTICSSIIDRDWSATYSNPAFRARRNLDVVVASSIVRNVLETFGENGDELFVERPSHLDRVV